MNSWILLEKVVFCPILQIRQPKTQTLFLINDKFPNKLFLGCENKFSDWENLPKQIELHGWGLWKSHLQWRYSRWSSKKCDRLWEPTKNAGINT